MVFSIFRNNSPILLLIIPVLCITLWAKSFLEPSQVTYHFDTVHMPLYAWLNGLISPGTRLAVIIGFILMGLQTFLLERLNNIFILVEKRSYLPVIFFFFLSSAFVSLQRLTPAIVANLFILLALFRLFHAYKKNKAFSNIFDASLLISTGSLFYSGLIYLIIVVWVGVAILRPFNLREWIISLVGFLVPYAFTFFFYFYTDNLDVLLTMLESQFQYFSQFKNLTIPNYAYLGLVLFISLGAMLGFISRFSARKITIRNYFLVILWLLLFSVAGGASSFVASFEMVTVVAIPLSLILSMQFSEIKSTIFGEVLFGLFFVSTYLSIYLTQ